MIRVANELPPELILTTLHCLGDQTVMRYPRKNTEGPKVQQGPRKYKPRGPRGRPKGSTNKKGRGKGKNTRGPKPKIKDAQLGDGPLKLTDGQNNPALNGKGPAGARMRLRSTFWSDLDGA